MNIAWNCQSILACRHSPKSSPENPANGMTEGIERIRSGKMKQEHRGDFPEPQHNLESFRDTGLLTLDYFLL
jgi:hypothetical protein